MPERKCSIFIMRIQTVLYPGGGHIDFKSVLKTVKETGYQGFISGEHRPDPEPAVAAARGLEFLKNIEKEI